MSSRLDIGPIAIRTYTYKDNHTLVRYDHPYTSLELLVLFGLGVLTKICFTSTIVSCRED